MPLRFMVPLKLPLVEAESPQEAVPPELEALQEVLREEDMLFCEPEGSTK